MTGVPGEPLPAPAPIPQTPSNETLRSYVDVTKWTTGVAAAAVVFGFPWMRTAMSAPPASSAVSRALYVVGSVGFLVAGVAGTLTAMFSFRYMSLREELAAHQAAMPRMAQGAALGQLHRTVSRANVLYHVHCWAFVTGVALTGILALIS